VLVSALKDDPVDVMETKRVIGEVLAGQHDAG
jgi:hypothetical protein